jgi:LuxR family maltose regulon positive regulatory protein
MGLDLSPADVTALGARTEGWVASLQLAAMSLRGREDKRAFVAAFPGSHRYVMDYLVDEVMTKQPPEVRAFLRQTSILDRLCASLCDAALDISSSREILRQLEDDNLFLIPLDDERRWYRYHHLFAGFLGQRLREREPERIPALHRRASRWHEAQGVMDDAIEHALAAGDLERAARLVGQIAEALIVRRNPVALQEWIDRLPAELCRGYPMLCLWHAWALVFVGQLDAVEPILEVVEAHRGQVPHLPLAGYATTVRAYVANQAGDLARAVALSQRALDQMADAPPEHVTLVHRGAAVIWLAVNYRHLGDLDRARVLFLEAASLNRRAGNYYAALATKDQLGDMARMQGQLHHAAEHYRRGLRMARAWSDPGGRGGGALLAESGPHLGLGTVLYQWNDLAGAAPHIQRAVELCELGGAWERMYGYRMLAYLRQAEGDLAAAYDLLQRACAIRDAITVRQMNVSVEPGLEQLRIMLGRARPEMAHLLADVARRFETLGLRPDDGDLSGPIDFASPTGYRREHEYADLARALVALDQAGEALPLLDRLLVAARSMERWGDAIRYLAQRALAFHASGDTPSALACLDQALTLAEPEGYVRLFVDEGEPMAVLLRRAAARGILPDYVDRLLAAFGTAVADVESVDPSFDDRPSSMVGCSSSVVRRPSSLIEPLSARELEVLQRMAEGLKHAQIAEQLVISLNTVRHHTRNIYGKLDVHSRAQAVARARELGIL